MGDLCQDSQAGLACQWNNLSCALSILKRHVSAEVCLLGHQWISRGFTLTRYLDKLFSTINIREAERFIGQVHWTLITQEMKEDLQIDFSQEKFF